MLNHPRRALWAGLLAAASLGAPAFAISDGGYDPAKNGCSPNAEDSYRPAYVQDGCYTAAVRLSDKTHTYVLAGIPQTATHTGANAVDLCVDVTGTLQCIRFGKDGTVKQFTRSGSAVNPGSGEVHAYFGADDNLDNGEHDGSSAVANGPSDGGSVQANITPTNAVTWLATVLSADRSGILTHPLPAADAGTGACADGICFSVQTQRRVAYAAGGKNPDTRNAANYDGHEWDPPNCGGPSDTKTDCGGKHDLSWWHKHNQTAYVEPGITVYEDPDPQGSPIGPYPIPAFYVGTCGVVAGGGNAPAFPASDYTNSRGQFVYETGC